MLQMAKQNGFHLGAALFPSNPMDYSFRSCVHEGMPAALREGVALQTMKPAGGKFILDGHTVTPAECLRYALQPTSALMHGMDKMERLEQTLDAVKNFKPLMPSQIKARAAAMSGRYELFKTAALRFDREESAMAGMILDAVRSRKTRDRKAQSR